MAETVLISVFCQDRTGLIAAVTGELFSLGANLGDTTFSVLGTGAEFNSVCELPDGVTGADALRELESLPELEEGEISVTPLIWIRSAARSATLLTGLSFRAAISRV